MAALKGLIAFFDVLGYSDIVSNNHIEIAATMITDTLTKIREDVEKSINCFISAANSNSQDFVKPVLDRMDWVVFSDSIVLALADCSENPDRVRIDWMMFILECAVLQRTLFGSQSRGSRA